MNSALIARCRRASQGLNAFLIFTVLYSALLIINDSEALNMSKDNPISTPVNVQQINCDPLASATAMPLLAADSFASQAKGKTGVSRIIKAAGYSIDGLQAAYKFEAAFRQVLWLNVLLFIALIFLPLAIPTKMLLLISCFLSLIVELFNTGIEACVDHTSTEQHPLAKIAKDVGSAAQFLALLLMFVLWMLALSSLLY